MRRQERVTCAVLRTQSRCTRPSEEFVNDEWTRRNSRPPIIPKAFRRDADLSRDDLPDGIFLQSRLQIATTLTNSTYLAVRAISGLAKTSSPLRKCCIARWRARTELPPHGSAEVQAPH